MPWVAVWEDTFDGQSGQSPDPSKWKFEIGTGSGGWGNNQKDYETDRAENASLDGRGHLIITARREAYNGSTYTSARMKTEGKYAPKFGKIEARIKLPSGQGLWPAFWMLGANDTSVGWPNCGEIDIMEERGSIPNAISGSAIGPHFYNGDALTMQYVLAHGTFADDFHVFALEWEPDVLRFSVDGIEYEERNATYTTNRFPSTRWVFNDHPFFLLLNLAVGGNYDQDPGPGTVFPAQMIVDYVRVFSRATSS